MNFKTGKLSFTANLYSNNNYALMATIDFIFGKKYCHRKYLDEVLKDPILPRGFSRDKKFSNIGQDLTAEIYAGKTFITKRKINKIAIHCTATPIGRDLGAKEIDNMHINRWGATSGCGYHYIIRLDGSIEKGRWVDSPGAHVEGRNSDTIGISYVGGVDNKLNPKEDHATPEQMKSLQTLINLLVKEYNLNPEDVLGHREFPKVYKACPCLTMSNIRNKIKV